MAQIIPVLPAAVLAEKRNWRMIVWVVLALTACDRDAVPPSPADPVRPKMLSVEKSVQKTEAPLVQKAIFTYTRHTRASASGLMPEAADVKCCRLQV